MVVLPALSKPRTRIRASLSPNNVANSLDTNMPIVIPCLSLALAWNSQLQWDPKFYTKTLCALLFLTTPASIPISESSPCPRLPLSRKTRTPSTRWVMKERKLLRRAFHCVRLRQSASPCVQWPPPVTRLLNPRTNLYYFLLLYIRRQKIASSKRGCN